MLYDLVKGFRGAIFSKKHISKDWCCSFEIRNLIEPYKNFYNINQDYFQFKKTNYGKNYAVDDFDFTSCNCQL